MSQYITLAPCGGQDWYYMLSTVNETTVQAYRARSLFTIQNKERALSNDNVTLYILSMVTFHG